MQAKKFINFSTVWQNYNEIKDSPYNLYSATKNSFGKIINFYENKHKEVKFYNVFIVPIHLLTIHPNQHPHAKMENLT